MLKLIPVSYTHLRAHETSAIMNVMEEYADEDRSFYDWHVQNGKGYEVEIDPELWKKGRKFLHVIREL